MIELFLDFIKYFYKMAKNSNQRADVKNPNNSAFKAATDNRSVQLNTLPVKAKIELPKSTVESKKK